MQISLGLVCVLEPADHACECRDSARWLVALHRVITSAYQIEVHVGRVDDYANDACYDDNHEYCGVLSVCIMRRY